MTEGLSQRRACRLVGISRRGFGLPAREDRDVALRDRLRATWRPNMGYRMAHALVKADFAPLNVKRVHRLWKEEKLGRMRRYRKRRTGDSVPFKASKPNEVWTVDFVFDSCLNGTKLKILSVVDEVTRECLALEVDTRLNARRVRGVLGPIMEERGSPKFVRSDNGGEFIARSIAVFLSQSKSESKFIDPGSLWQNAFVESFHSTLRRDHLDVELFHNLADAQLKTAVYRRYYNEERPHSSLGYRTPAAAAEVWRSARATPSQNSKLQPEKKQESLRL
jgi:putative transposase